MNRAGVIVPSLSSPFVAVPAFWRDHLRDDRVERRVKLSRTLASYLQGEEVDPAFLNRDLEHAFRNERRMWKGESLPLNAYYPQMEEQALARLAANS